MEDKDMMTVTTPATPDLLPLASSWLTGAARVGPYLVVRMGDRLYAYDAPRWALGVLRGWSAQGASVGRLWRTLRLSAFARVEVEEADVDLVPALVASLEAA